MSNPKKIEELEEATELSGDDMLLTSVQRDSDTFVSKTINLRQVAQFAYPEFAIGPNTQCEPLISWEEVSADTAQNTFPNDWRWNRSAAQQSETPWYCNPIRIEHNGILSLRIDTGKIDHNMIPVDLQYGRPNNDGFTWVNLVHEDTDNPGNSNTMFIPVLNGTYVRIGTSGAEQWNDYKSISLVLFYNP